MLKFKLTKDSKGIDEQELQVISFERSNSPVYELGEEGIGDVYENINKVEYIFTVDDLHNIQPNSRIKVVTRAMVSGENNEEGESYYNTEECIVTSISKSENKLSFNVDKEYELNVETVTIGTQYKAIYFLNNKWNIDAVNREWISSQIDNFENIIYVDTNTAPYGANIFDDSTLFYYENDSWKNVNLVGQDLEGCLKGNYVDLTSFHKYDVDGDGNPIKRKALEMDTHDLYYTRENYITLNLANSHYFGTPIETYEEEKISDDYETNKMTEYNRPIIDKIDYPKIYLYIDYNDGISESSTEIKIVKECHTVDSTTLLFNFDNFKDNATIEKIVEKDLTIEEMMKFADTTETVYSKMTEEDMEVLEKYFFPYGYDLETVSEFGEDEKTDEIYDIAEQYGVVGNIKFKRDNFVIDSNNVVFSLYYDSVITKFKIPITQKFETDLHHNDMLQTNYVEKAKKNAINSIVDMEKYVYTPAISKENLENDKQINSDYIDCFKIIFNLHFRKHRDTTTLNGTTQEWACDRTAYWNGMKEEKKTVEDKEYTVLSLRPSISEDDKNGDMEGYFSYFPVESYSEYQSDLLSFLGFSNDDIKYQKSKLKKSFLRISFYDSENVGNQNLLQTSTIFLDSGNLFAKYIKNIETVDINEEGTYMATVGTSHSADTKVSYDVNGVRVNREPIRDSGINEDDLKDDINDLEDLRLSSQIVVTDKFTSKHSSEGFYFYTYKTNDNGVYPSDIYMRVEFNHAGYGRTIPFMMPYVRENEITEGKYDEKHIKTFKEICDEWSELDSNGEPKDEEEIGYGSLKYVKYCHIKWKYRYDKDTQKHIYYLDPEAYGDSVTAENKHGNNIILNLYEGKIR